MPYSVFQSGSCFGLLAEGGAVVLPAVYDAINNNGSFIMLNKGGKWACFNQHLKPLTGFIYERIDPFYCGRAAVCRIYNSDTSGSWGYIDETGAEVIPPIYDSASDFEDNLAWVSIEGYDLFMYNTRGDLETKADMFKKELEERLQAYQNAMAQSHEQTPPPAMP